jgi:hypothetical protein
MFNNYSKDYNLTTSHFGTKKIIGETKEMAPPWLPDKINVKQDPILPMKFNL